MALFHTAFLHHFVIFWFVNIFNFLLFFFYSLDPTFANVYSNLKKNLKDRNVLSLVFFNQIFVFLPTSLFLSYSGLITFSTKEDEFVLDSLFKYIKIFSFFFLLMFFVRPTNFDYKIYLFSFFFIKFFTLRNFFSLLFQLPLFIISVEVVFYFVHRFLHLTRFFYQSIHSIHHRFTHPSGITSLYCHPLEFLFCNILSVAVGPMIWSFFFGSLSFDMFNFWIVLSTTNAIVSHTFLDDPHMDHHLFFNVEFGVLGVLDKMLGTRK